MPGKKSEPARKAASKVTPPPSPPSGGWLKSCGMLLAGLAVMVAVYVSANSTPDEGFSSEEGPDPWLWGTYRPGVYFGMRTREPQEKAVLAGLLWHQASRQGVQEIRHSAQETKDVLFGWKQHNGRGFGTQQIRDVKLGMELETHWAARREGSGTRDGGWSVRVSTKALPKRSPKRVALAFYLAGHGEAELGTPYRAASGALAVQGRTESLGDFTLMFVPHEHKDSKMTMQWITLGDPELKLYEGMPEDVLWPADAHYQHSLHRWGSGKQKIKLPDRAHEHAKMVYVQFTVKPPFDFDVAFVPHSADSPTPSVQVVLDGVLAASNRSDSATVGGALTEELRARKAAFEGRFEARFGLGAKGFSEAEQEAGMAALSGLVGSTGYFHGPMLESVPGSERPKVTAPAELFTGVPARNKFPRGFLWDEGFHQLLAGLWDDALSKEVLGSWLKRTQADGWIAREQILGDEARSRVPAEFQAQHRTHGNPPTLLFQIERVLLRHTSGNVRELHPNWGARLADNGGAAAATEAQLKAHDLQFLRSVYPALQANFAWWVRTQATHKSPEVPSKTTVARFRWNGADGEGTLACGLDDYPRAHAQHRNARERHVDLLSWMALYARVLAALSATAGDTSEKTQWYRDLQEQFTRSLSAHWNPATSSFCDWSGHPKIAPSHGGPPSKFVQEQGYVSLFPLLLGLLPCDSPHLAPTLDLMADTKRLRTPYGLRSLSKMSAIARAVDAGGIDSNYWRGPIWININYLALSSLKRNYMGKQCAAAEKATKVYTELRKDLVANLVKIYHKGTPSGFLWESYSHIDGAGRGCHPFTGWSALLLNIMAEKY